MKNLVLITNSFPEKGKETFLIEELPFLSKYFKKVIIFTLKPIKNHIEIPANVSVSNVFSLDVSKGEKFWYLLFNWSSIFKALKLEKKNGGLSLLLKFGVQSDRLDSFLKEKKINDTCIVL